MFLPRILRNATFTTATVLVCALSLTVAAGCGRTPPLPPSGASFGTQELTGLKLVEVPFTSSSIKPGEDYGCIVGAIRNKTGAPIRILTFALMSSGEGEAPRIAYGIIRTPPFSRPRAIERVVDATAVGTLIAPFGAWEFADESVFNVNLVLKLPVLLEGQKEAEMFRVVIHGAP